MLRVIETFSGIGSQAQALKNANIEHKVVSTVEWEIGAMYAYDIIHNGAQNLREFRHHTKESLISELSAYNISSDGKSAITSRALASMNISQLRAILCSIERNNNLVDIMNVEASNFPEADMLTYSFPCQDLSVAGIWHNNSGGIDRNANNRSTLLWQIERILKQYVTIGKKLPRFLIMENVSNILSKKHIKNFKEWQSFLENLGYYNKIYTLDARNFEIPQSRIRTYMISVLVPKRSEAKKVENYFLMNNLEKIQLSKARIRPISDFLRLDYSIEKYRKEAIESTPMWTPSREKIYNENCCLAIDKKANNSLFAKTITTKQDRHPNSGIIRYSKEVLTNINTKYRNLTPRECFLLMGFDEEKFDLLMQNNIKIGKDRRILPPSKLIRLAGNSIVVQVLESIFLQINEINDLIFGDKANGKEI